VKVVFGLLWFFGGLALCLVGCYVHYTTVVGIPAAAMTLRLEWSGWEWFAGGAFFFFVTGLCFLDKKSK
jgi:hypothetical protein